MRRGGRAFAAGGACLLLAGLLAACGSGEPSSDGAGASGAATPAATVAPMPTVAPTPTVTPTPAVTPTPTATPAVTPTALPTPVEVVSFGDGEFAVGTDIPAGLYRASAPADDCEWERRSADGVTGFGDASFLLTIVALAPSDVSFSSRGCGSWSNDPEPVATPGQPFGDGAFFVGPEVAPGRYRATGGSDACWWYRLSGFDDPHSRDLTWYGGAASERERAGRPCGR